MRVNHNDAKTGKSKALELLNQRKPQFPPDVYYIRRSPRLLEKFVENKRALNRMVLEAPSGSKESYKIFQLKENDIQSSRYLQNSPTISEADPFWKKPVYEPRHTSVRDTDDLRRILDSSGTRKHADGNSLRAAWDLEDRFYKKEVVIPKERRKISLLM